MPQMCVCQSPISHSFYLCGGLSREVEICAWCERCWKDLPSIRYSPEEWKREGLDAIFDDALTALELAFRSNEFGTFHMIKRLLADKAGELPCYE